VSRGALVGLDVTWKLARLWYANRLEPDWRRPNAAEAEATLASVGLEGPFWQLG
jgi:hypothetical protein